MLCFDNMPEGPEHPFGAIRFQEFENGFAASVLKRSDKPLYECAVMDNPLGEEKGWRINYRTELGDIREFSALYQVNLWLADVVRLRPDGSLPPAATEALEWWAR